jgi:hypothetical protein
MYVGGGEGLQARARLTKGGKVGEGRGSPAPNCVMPARWLALSLRCGVCSGPSGTPCTQPAPPAHPSFARRPHPPPPVARSRRWCTWAWGSGSGWWGTWTRWTCCGREQTGGCGVRGWMWVCMGGGALCFGRQQAGGGGRLCEALCGGGRGRGTCWWQAWSCNSWQCSCLPFMPVSKSGPPARPFLPRKQAAAGCGPAPRVHRRHGGGGGQ